MCTNDRNLFLPATAYFASNVTAILALGYLRSYIFSAIMNTRIVFGAILSVILLRKSTTGQQWKGIAVIVCAVTLLCLEDMKVSIILWEEYMAFSNFSHQIRTDKRNGKEPPDTQ